MGKEKMACKVTLWVGRIVGVALVGLVFFLPAILQWYAGFRFLTKWDQTVITVAFYCCTVVIGWALWGLDGILRRILRGEVFVRQNVRAIRQIQWCCALVGVITGLTCFAYLPLVFLAVIMGFLFLVVDVVGRVMDAAVSLREENDLTI